MIKKILQFLKGPKVEDLRTNSPCKIVRDGGYCPYINVYMPCKECIEFERGNDVRERDYNI